MTSPTYKPLKRGDKLTINMKNGLELTCQFYNLTIERRKCNPTGYLTIFDPTATNNKTTQTTRFATFRLIDDIESIKRNGIEPIDMQNLIKNGLNPTKTPLEQAKRDEQDEFIRMIQAQRQFVIDGIIPETEDAVKKKEPEPDDGKIVREQCARLSDLRNENVHVFTRIDAEFTRSICAIQRCNCVGIDAKPLQLVNVEPTVLVVCSINETFIYDLKLLGAENAFDGGLGDMLRSNTRKIMFDGGTLVRNLAENYNVIVRNVVDLKRFGGDLGESLQEMLNVAFHVGVDEVPEELVCFSPVWYRRPIDGESRLVKTVAKIAVFLVPLYMFVLRRKVGAICPEAIVDFEESATAVVLAPKLNALRLN